MSKDKFAYRVINHWESIGLFTSKRSSERGWRKYSIIDILWLNIILELRKLGYPMEKIFLVKENLQKPSCEFPTQFPLLEFYVRSIIASKYPVYLLVFENGQVEPVRYIEYQLALESGTIGNHITIFLNKILQEIMPKSDLNPEFHFSIPLSNEEMELLYMIREKNYKYIKVILSNGKIDRYEANEDINIERRFIDIINDKNYQKIEVEVADGKVVHINRSEKIKIT